MKPNNTFFLIIAILFLGLGISVSPLFAQNVIDDILFDDAENTLEGGIKNMNRRKAAIAYNIANATTPDFKPYRFPDEIEEAIRLYGDPSILDQVNIDDEMVKATRVRLQHSAYVRLLSTKMSITKRIVTLGKGG